jgi:uncharacterized membrane protein
MTLLLLFALAMAVVLLRNQLTSLRARVDALEAALEAFRTAPSTEPRQARTAGLVVRRSAATRPAPWVDDGQPTTGAEPPLPSAPEAPGEPKPSIEPIPVEPDDVALARAEEDPVELEPAPTARAGFEDMFGRRLPIWAGGGTLAVAGFFVVKYSIDAGLISPLVRVLFGLLFGTGLIAAAEIAYRQAGRVRDPRIRQALAGAGVATLYASILVAANLYALVSPGAAFAGLAATTVLAGLLSIRFGAASAVLGLLGGLSAPALVDAGPPDMALLASYLALAVGGLCALGRTQRWWWLGAAALAGGFGWGMTLIVAGALDAAAILSLGTYTLLIGVAFPLLLAEGPTRALRWAGLLAGCAQMAAIVATGGFAPLTWALYGLLGGATVWLSFRDARLREAPAAALVVGVMLAIAWPVPPASQLALVVTGIALIFGLPAAWRAWRDDGKLVDAGQVALVGLAIGLLPLHRLSGAPAGGFALLGALLVTAVAALGWHRTRADHRFPLLAGTSGLLLAIAAGLAGPDWTLAPAVAAVAGLLLLVGRAAGDPRVGGIAALFGVAAALLLPVTGGGWSELARSFGTAARAPAAMALLRWAVTAAIALTFARYGGRRVAPAAQVLAVLLGYVALAQSVPASLLPLLPAAMLAGLALARRATTLAPALITAGLLSSGWAAADVARWAATSLGALVGYPAYVANLPGWSAALTRLAAPALGLGIALALDVVSPRLRRLAIGAAGLLGVAAIHILYKQLFAIADHGAFVAHAMAERTAWEGLLAAVAAMAWIAGRRQVAATAGGLALAHFAWFTLLLHNPLWADQYSGPWLFAAYCLAGALVWASAKLDPTPRLAHAREAGLMIVILASGVSLLRQLIHGELLSSPGLTPAEDIARSVFAIAAAIAFLAWGIRSAQRDWRLASLALMLLAVGKVFLFDAAGLDGLARIASFAALGFSLLGVGWLYARYLPARE